MSDIKVTVIQQFFLLTITQWAKADRHFSQGLIKQRMLLLL